MTDKFTWELGDITIIGGGEGMEIEPYMGKEQREYLEAAARVKEIMAKVDADLPPTPKRGGGNLEAFAVAHEAAATRHHLDDALEAKQAAQWALLDWAKGILEIEMAGDPDLPRVLASFDTAPKYSAMLDELIGLCLELDPEKGDDHAND